jgi:N-acetylglucosaminyldiphosphoundecaprenol N-acetyl-beta-D-mannosaminyltransferase
MIIYDNFKIDLSSKTEICQKAFAASRFRICTFNPEMLIKSLEDPALGTAIKNADSIIPDGTGLVLLLKKGGAKQAQRLPGIELAWSLLDQAVKNNLKIALIGSTQAALDGTINKINQELGHFNLVYAQNGFFKDQSHVIDALEKARPDLTLMALPFSIQEKILSEYPSSGVCLGVGGSFEVWAGLVKRAPAAWQNLGLEWLWRLSKQPARFGRLAKIIWPFCKIYLQA